jgi:hypothetical protein
MNNNLLNFINKKPQPKTNRYVEKNNVLYIVSDIGRVVFEPILLRVNDKVFGNSSQLQYAEMNFGRAKNWGETKLQKSLVESKISMIPFSVFTEAKLDMSKMQIVESGKPESIKVKDGKKFRNTHFTGACLFKIDFRFFLFDIDRREIEHGIMNAFLVELKKPCKTIKDAYHSLKPKEVLEAEAKGLKVKRQGEWFFIPCLEKPKGTEAKSSKDRWTTDSVTYELQAGNNRPNIVNQVILDSKKTIIAVKGKVSHAGREHADMILTDWHMPIPNTSVASFTLTGRVD